MAPGVVVVEGSEKRGRLVGGWHGGGGVHLLAEVGAVDNELRGAGLVDNVLVAGYGRGGDDRGDGHGVVEEILTPVELELREVPARKKTARKGRT